MKFNSFILSMLLLAGCSHDGILYQEEDGNLSLNEGKTMFYVPPFELQNGGQTTRTDLEINQDVASFKWVAGDEVGIFAFDAEGNRKGDQVYFSVDPDPADPQAAEAVFDGGGWQIKKGMKYCAYYPFVPLFRLNPQDMRADFTGQKMLANNDYSHIGDYDYMVSMPKGQAAIDGGMSFEFRHLGALCIAKIHATEDGTLKSLKFQFEDGSTPFVQTAQFDASKGNLAALTPLTSAASFTVEMNNISVKENTPIEVPFMLCPTQVKDKTCKVILTYDNNNGQQIMRANEFKFQANIEGGKGYGYNLSFPKIDPATHVIINPIAGSLCMDHVTEAMGEGDMVIVKGEIDFKDFELLCQAAGAPAKTTSRGTSNPVLTDLDLEDIHFLEGKTPGTNWYMELVDFPSVAGTQLERLVLPRGWVNLPAGIFNGVPLKTLEWYYGLSDFKITVDPKVFEGLKTEECDLKLNNKEGHMYQFISADENGNMLFNGCRFKSIKERKKIINEDTYEYDITYVDIETTKADAGAHSINAFCPGFFTDAKITEALAGGTTLKVTGNLNDRDLTTIAAYKAASITSLTFDNVGEYVPTAANVFAGCNYSANCDLVIPDAWKNLVSVVDGKLMFGGVAWKSIKDTTGKDLFDGVAPNPGIDPWTPGEGGDLETE